MKVQLLPSTFESGGGVSQRQHLSCIIIDDTLAFDAGSLAMSCSDQQRERIRDVFISHTHLDHTAGLPMFLDDLFSTLVEPVRVHAAAEMIETLERNIFNWSIYPKFSELRNSNGPVLEYFPFEFGSEITIGHLSVMPIEVNHHTPSVGALISDGRISIGITGDTAKTDLVWEKFNGCQDLAAILVECAFPNELSQLADASQHMTPVGLAAELEKFTRTDVPIWVINIKPMFREQVVKQIGDLAIPDLQVLEVGRVYEF